MDAPRQRIYSFSSNETILETYSSSPPSSADPAGNSALSTWQLSARDLMTPVCRGLSSGQIDDPQKRDRGDGEVRARAEEQQQIPEVVEELEDEVHTQEGDDSEESVDWDEETEDELEREERRHYRRLMYGPKAQATFPQTVGFWVDWWLGEIAFAAIDLQALCASMQLWRDKNDIARGPTQQVELYQHQEFTPSPPPIAYGTDALRDPDGSFASHSDWDGILQEMKLTARDMHQTRKWRAEGRKNAAGWCKWGARQLVCDRGEFVEEAEVGYEVERELDGLKLVVKLGYRRNDAVVDDMDLDGDEGCETSTSAYRRSATCGDVAAEEDLQTQPITPAQSSSIDADVGIADSTIP